MYNYLLKKMLVIGIFVLFIGVVIAPSIPANPENQSTESDLTTTSPQNIFRSYWQHENVTQYNITNSYRLLTPERGRCGTAYNYGNFSIVPSRDEEKDPWLVWIDDENEVYGAHRFKDIPYSSHAGFSIQIDSDGYIWATPGGYADEVPLDLYKSNIPLSTADSTGYTLMLDNYATKIGVCGQTVIILDDKVNLFFRNWWNDHPDTGIQQLQYAIDDFTAPLIDREIAKGELISGNPIVPCYTWGRIDPRYGIGFLTMTWKRSIDNMWGSYPFIGLLDNGNTLVTGDNFIYSLPFHYAGMADIPLDNIKQGVRAASSGVQMGISPDGIYYMLNQQYIEPDTIFDYFLLMNDGSGWYESWRTAYPILAHNAASVISTKDYIVMVYGGYSDRDNNIFVTVSGDNGVTWSHETMIIEEDDIISGITIAQPDDMSDNIVRFFYGKAESLHPAIDKYCFVKFNASKFATVKADANGPYFGLIDEPVQFSGSAIGGYTPYSWYWDFGDTHSSDEQNPMHTFTSPGEYTVTLTVTDDSGNTSDDTTWAWIQDGNTPPDAPDIDGPTNGAAGTSYPYTFTAVDPESAIVWYYVEWGDETNTGWFGPYSSGVTVTKSHKWSGEGTYTIKAKAKDPYDDEGPWGELTVTMPRNKLLLNTPFLNFLQSHPNLFPILRQLLGL